MKPESYNVAINPFLTKFKLVGMKIGETEVYTDNGTTHTDLATIDDDQAARLYETGCYPWLEPIVAITKPDETTSADKVKEPGKKNGTER